MKESPKAGAIGTILSFLFGSMLHLDKATQDEITFWLQTMAFIISLIVGILTIWISVRKLRQKTIKE